MLLLRSAIIGILLLTMIHVCISLSLVDPHSGFFDLLHITTILILIIMFSSISIKGLVPVAISWLGIVLLYGSIVIPAIDNSLGPFYYKASIGYLTFETINYGTHGFFLLGVSMIFLGMIVAYKPHILYTRNRPNSTEQLWTKYPNWDENLQLAISKTDSLIGLSNLLSDKERYLEIWIHSGFYLWHSISSFYLLTCPNKFDSHKGIKITQDHWSTKVRLLHIACQNHVQWGQSVGKHLFSKIWIF